MTTPANFMQKGKLIYLQKFYLMTIEPKGNTFKKELYSYVSYKEYKAMQKSQILQKHIKDTIHYDKRQTSPHYCSR